MKTLEQLAHDAVMIQSASNLCGVAQSFAQAMVDIGRYTQGTKERNLHFITTLWIDKLVSLNNYSDPKSSAAFNWCWDMAKKHDKDLKEAKGSEEKFL